MSYSNYALSGQCPGKCLYQLAQIGVPSHIVSSVIFNGENSITYNGILFANYKYNETDTPIFKFSEPYAVFKQLKQPSFVVLFGLKNTGKYEEVGLFTEVNGFPFKETLSKYPKTFIADFDGVPLREQILNPTTFEDKFNRLKNKFSK